MSTSNNTTTKHLGVTILTSSLILSALFSILPVSVLASDETATVSGEVWYHKQGEDPRPLPLAYVEIRDSDPGPDELVVAFTTNLYGQFSVTFHNDVDPWPADRRCDCYVKVYSEAPRIVFIGDPGLIQLTDPRLTWSFSTHDDMDDGFHDFGRMTVGDEGDGDDDAIGAYRTMDTIVAAWRYVYGHTSTNVRLPPVNVVFPCGADDFCFSDTPWFDPFGFGSCPTPCIHMTKGQSRDTIVHEYGHFVMWAAYGGEWPVPEHVYGEALENPFDIGCQIAHRVDKFCDSRIGWTEGWADFFALVVNEGNFLSSDGFADVPTRIDFESSWAHSGWDTGPGVEGRVTATLWDMFDTSDFVYTDTKNNDACDRTSVDFNTILDTLGNTGPHTNFREFFPAFASRYPSKAHVIHAAAFQNSITAFEAGPPSPRLVSPSPGTWFSQNSPNVIISVEVNDPDGTEGDGADFFYSTDGLNWIPIPATPSNPVVQTGGIIQLEWNAGSTFAGFESPTVLIKADVRDEVSGCSGLIGSDVLDSPLGVENTPPTNVADITSNPAVNVWTSDDTIELSWAPASDTGTVQSGVRGYEVLFTTGATRLCPFRVSIGGRNVILFTEATSVVSPPLEQTGDWSVAVAAEDKAGNCGPQSSLGPFLIDIDPPSSPLLVHPAFQERTNIQPVLEWSHASDPDSGDGYYNLQLTNRVICNPLACLDLPDWQAPGLQIARVDFDAALPTVTYPAGPLSSGRWFWRVQAVDNAGNVGAWSEGRFTVDAPPVITVPPHVVQEATGPSGANVTYTVTAHDDFDTTVAVVCDPPQGSTFQIGGTTVNCSATDSFDNTATGSFVVTVQDTTLPDTVIVSAIGGNGASLADGALTLFQSITITSTGSDLVGVASLQCSLDGSAFATCPSLVNYGNLALGTHVFKVRATDTSGNTDSTPASFTWTIITPKQASQNLIDSVNTMNTVNSTRRGLLGPLRGVLQILSDNNAGNDLSACNMLRAFVALVNQYETSGRLTPMQAANLRLQATNIQIKLGCP